MVGRLKGFALGNKLAMKDSEYKILGVFDWKVKEVEALA